MMFSDIFLLLTSSSKSYELFLYFFCIMFLIVLSVEIFFEPFISLQRISIV